MRCPKCGREVSDKAGRCPACNTALSSSVNAPLPSPDDDAETIFGALPRVNTPPAGPIEADTTGPVPGGIGAFTSHSKDDAETVYAAPSRPATLSSPGRIAANTTGPVSIGTGVLTP